MEALNDYSFRLKKAWVNESQPELNRISVSTESDV